MGNEYNYFEHIFKQSFEDDSTESLLDSITRQYPYFGPAHFFLLAKTDQNIHHYQQQAAKTALYFNNTYWLDYQLNKYRVDHPKYANTKVVPLLPDEDQVHVVEMTESIVNQSIDSENKSQVNEDIQPDTILEPSNQPEEMVSPELDETAVEQQNDPEVPPIQLNFDKSVIETTEDSFQFQPLHTSDYFASQGIRLSEQVAGTDKFGKQLKSFTEWLKTMKKIHSTADFIQATGATPGIEKAETAVNELAEKSNTEAEILTEAMAEVLLQQGKSKKAQEVYEKLSLQNPAKNTYFAAKIEQLKES